jgi:hypothetical protein
MIDIGAFKKSTADYGQYLAYKNTITNNTDINTMQTRAINIQFGIGSTASIRSVIVKTPFSQVNFYIIKADTLFLLSLIDIDRLQVYYNNITDTLISPVFPTPSEGNKLTTLLVTRRFGHLFLV